MDEPNQEHLQAEEQPAPQEEGDGQQEGQQPPWGDEFDAQRAWSTIQNLRGEVKEAKQNTVPEQDREFLAALRDPDRYEQALAALGLELADDEEEEFPDLGDDTYGEEEGFDPYEQRLSGIEQTLEQQQEMEDLRAFDGHLDDLASGADVELSQRDRRYLLTASQEHGFSPDATEKAFGEWLEDRKAYEKQVIEGYVKGKKGAPRVAPGGTTANEVPNLDDRQERVSWMTEQLQNAQQDQ